MRYSSRLLGLVACLAGSVCFAQTGKQQATQPPNFIVIFVDDLGYGDLGCYGHSTIRTPNLDRMAAQGARFTEFYAPASVCTPSRAGLLTGRLPVRSGMASIQRRVMFEDSKGGLPKNEITIAESLRDAGYATACIGKWHLGHLKQHLPRNHGFDYFWGVPYSNDMDVSPKNPGGIQAYLKPRSDYWNVPLMHNEQIVERPAKQETLTRRFTEQTIKFIRRNQKQRFFVYLTYTMPHVPLFPGKQYLNTSRRGLYGDVVEELDAAVGSLLTALRQLQLDKNTLVLFTSDNGPWKTFATQGGSSGPLRAGKSSVFEGGIRVPCIAWWPLGIRAGLTVRGAYSALDIFPTLASLAGARMPGDRVYDGYNLVPVFSGNNDPGVYPRVIHYYVGDELWAIRKGDLKAHFVTFDSTSGKRRTHNPPLFFDLGENQEETYPVTNVPKPVIQDFLAERTRHLKSVTPVENQMTKR